MLVLKLAFHRTSCAVRHEAEILALLYLRLSPYQVPADLKCYSYHGNCSELCFMSVFPVEARADVCDLRVALPTVLYHMLEYQVS